MKKIAAILLIVTCTTSWSWGIEDKTVDTKIKDVTVFLNGAQVHRTGKFSVPAGVTKLVFEGASKYINKKSIQVNGKGSFIILDVTHNIKYPEPVKVEESSIPPKIKREIKYLSDSLVEVGFEADELKSRRDALNLEKSMLTNNKVIKGEAKNDSIPLLKDAMVFLRVKLADINKEMLKVKKKEYYLKIKRTRMQARLKDLKNYNTKSGYANKPKEPIQQIIVTVSADAASYGSMDINYTVSNAGWSPSYDLRADNTSEPVKLTYKANIYQSTGVDWSNVKLKLSSNDPNRSNVKPSLPVWYLNYYAPYRQQLGKYGDERNEMEGVPGTTNGTDNTALDTFSAPRDAKKDARTAASFTTMQQTLSNVEFSIKLPYTIESNGKPHLLPVKTEKIPASYYHYMVPKLDKDAFLMAKLTNWEELNLLPAKANIYYAGTYIGETRINPSVITDTMELAFGRDRSIIVTRKKLKDKEKEKTIGTDKIKTVVYELALKNNKSNSINLIIEDQLPVSKNEDIKVELEDKGKANFNEDTGFLKWDLKLKGRDSRKLEFSYTIKYNKDKTLALF
jgi:uncharacterized protein (TIGR02231 family)